MSLGNIGLYILAKASWIVRPFYSLSLLLDGIVYTVVAYAYKIFLIMSQIKFSELFRIMEPLINRVKALIMVLVMFKLGKSLIEYMIDPAKATSDKTGGAALVKNLGITAALLILYPFLFGVMNDISMLIIGGNVDNYEYLGKLVEASGGNDEGLLARFVWGSTVDTDEVDMGEWLAHKTLTLFVYDSDGGTVVEDTLKTNVPEGSSYNFMNVHNVVDSIGVGVEYTLPFVSSIMGLYLIYSLVKIAIEIGVRMFKMIILQILAPLAIVTIIDKGPSSSTFKTFYQTYISVFLEAIMRIGIVYIITTFIAAFFQNIEAIFSDVSMLNNGFLTKGLVCIIVLVAGYRVIGILPKFIDQALGTKMAGSAGGGGFGKFAAGLVGGAIGLGTGLAAGVAGGAGFLGTAGNMLSGAAGGFQAGGKGKNVADFFKNQAANTQASRDRAARINAQGGGLRYAGARLENALGITAAQNARAARYEREQKAYEAVNAARIAAIEKEKGNNGIAYGNNVDDYVSRSMEDIYNNDAEMQKIALAEEQMREKFRQEDAGNTPGTTSIEDRQYILDGFRQQRETQKSSLKSQHEAGFRNAWNGAYQSASNNEIKNASRTLGAVGGRDGRQAARSGSASAIQGGGKAAKQDKESVMSSGSYQRGHRQDGK